MSSSLQRHYLYHDLYHAYVVHVIHCQRHRRLYATITLHL
ncbi:hypothetical protein CCP2SC5_420036 [Azospirillaceae bacterium]